jgi:hypothetical protein
MAQIMEQAKIRQAVDKLGADFPNLNWNFRPDPSSGNVELISQWLGDEEEDVMLCVFKGTHIHERFHRQDFFFLNFAMQGDYRALSSRYDEATVIHEGDCYIGQPFSGYALRSHSEKSAGAPIAAHLHGCLFFCPVGKAAGDFNRQLKGADQRVHRLHVRIEIIVNFGAFLSRFQKAGVLHDLEMMGDGGPGQGGVFGHVDDAHPAAVAGFHHGQDQMLPAFVAQRGQQLLAFFQILRQALEFGLKRRVLLIHGVRLTRQRCGRWPARSRI